MYSASLYTFFLFISFVGNTKNKIKKSHTGYLKKLIIKCLNIRITSVRNVEKLKISLKICVVVNPPN